MAARKASIFLRNIADVAALPPKLSPPLPAISTEGMGFMRYAMAPKPSSACSQPKRKEMGWTLLSVLPALKPSGSYPKEGVRVFSSDSTQGQKSKEMGWTLLSVLPALKPLGSYPKGVRGSSSDSTQGQKSKGIGPLSSILSFLKDIPKPYPKMMFPSAYLKRDGVPNHEIVTRDGEFKSGGPMVYELRIDVWPQPLCWIIHGIWPAYICGNWLVHYRLEDMDNYEMDMLKESVKEEILKLDEATKKTLHEIWKSHKDSNNDAQQDIDFWAYEKVVHCWEQLNCPQGHYFNLTADLGKHVRQALLNWITKTNYTPNRFYTSQSIRNEMRKIFGVAVFPIVTADDDVEYDPKCTGLTFLQSLAFMIVKDPNQEFWYYMVDHPSGLTKVPRGFLYLLM